MPYTLPSILGFSGAAIAFTLLALGVVGLLSKTVRRTLFGWVSIGNPQLWSILFIGAGLVFGGLAYGSGLLASSSITTAAGIDNDMDEGEISAGAVNIGDCEFLQATEVAPASTNITLRADTSKLNHYYVDVKEDSGAGSVNATLSCPRITDNIRLGQSSVCYAKADSFRSETSTTDSNTYYIVATSSSASKIAGFPWSQTIYLKSGAVATTSDVKEKTELIWAQDAARQTLGVYATLPGATAFGYMNNQTSKDINIYCESQGSDKIVGTLTVTKVAGVGA